MQCPFCGQDRDKVVDSRSAEGGRVVRRRRHCQSCGRRYTTYERPEEATRITVVKKDGARESYQREKIIEGLQRAGYKRPAVTNEKIRQIVDNTEEEIFRQFDKEVPSSFIGDRVSEHLREVDQIAYIRFASVYRQFADVTELIAEAEGVQHAPGVQPAQRALFEQDDESQE